MALRSRINDLKFLGTNNLIHFLETPKVQRIKTHYTWHFQVRKLSIVSEVAVLTTSHQMAVALTAIARNDWKLWKDASTKLPSTETHWHRQYSTKS